MGEFSIPSVINCNLSLLKHENLNWKYTMVQVYTSSYSWISLIKINYADATLLWWCHEIKKKLKTVDYWRELFLISPKWIVSRNMVYLGPAGVHELSKVLIQGPAVLGESCPGCRFWDLQGGAGALPDADSVFSSWCRSCQSVLVLGSVEWGKSCPGCLHFQLLLPSVSVCHSHILISIY